MMKKLIILICLLATCIVKAATKAEAVFAMGCFWCAEADFRDKNGHFLLGISDLKVGYAGGTQPNPTYEHHAGYIEALKIIFDPAVMPYDKLLSIFWRNIDPFDAQGQFCDKGPSYTAAIFYKNENQRDQALKSKIAIETRLNKTVVTEIIPFTTFYDAEDYHQNYKAKNPVRYRYYRFRCGRDQRLKEIGLSK